MENVGHRGKSARRLDFGTTPLSPLQPTGNKKCILLPLGTNRRTETLVVDVDLKTSDRRAGSENNPFMRRKKRDMFDETQQKKVLTRQISRTSGNVARIGSVSKPRLVIKKHPDGFEPKTLKSKKITEFFNVYSAEKLKKMCLKPTIRNQNDMEVEYFPPVSDELLTPAIPSVISTSNFKVTENVGNFASVHGRSPSTRNNSPAIWQQMGVDGEQPPTETPQVVRGEGHSGYEPAATEGQLATLTRTQHLQEVLSPSVVTATPQNSRCLKKRARLSRQFSEKRSSEVSEDVAIQNVLQSSPSFIGSPSLSLKRKRRFTFLNDKRFSLRKVTPEEPTRIGIVTDRLLNDSNVKSPELSLRAYSRRKKGFTDSNCVAHITARSNGCPTSPVISRTTASKLSKSVLVSPKEQLSEKQTFPTIERRISSRKNNAGEVSPVIARTALKNRTYLPGRDEPSPVVGLKWIKSRVTLLTPETNTGDNPVSPVVETLKKARRSLYADSTPQKNSCIVLDVSPVIAPKVTKIAIEKTPESSKIEDGMSPVIASKVAAMLASDKFFGKSVAAENTTLRKEKSKETKGDITFSNLLTCDRASFNKLTTQRNQSSGGKSYEGSSTPDTVMPVNFDREYARKSSHLGIDRETSAMIPTPASRELSSQSYQALESQSLIRQNPSSKNHANQELIGAKSFSSMSPQSGCRIAAELSLLSPTVLKKLEFKVDGSQIESQNYIPPTVKCTSRRKRHKLDSKGNKSPNCLRQGVPEFTRNDIRLRDSEQCLSPSIPKLVPFPNLESITLHVQENNDGGPLVDVSKGCDNIIEAGGEDRSFSVLTDTSQIPSTVHPPSRFGIKSFLKKTNISPRTPLHSQSETQRCSLLSEKERLSLELGERHDSLSGPIANEFRPQSSNVTASYVAADVQLRPPSPPVVSYTKHPIKQVIVEEVENSAKISCPRLDYKPPSPVVNSQLNMRHLEVSDGMNSKADGDFPELPSSPVLNQRFQMRTSIQKDLVDVQLRPPSPPVFSNTQHFKKHVIVEEVDNSSASSFPRLDCRPPSPAINSRPNMKMRHLEVSDGMNSKADEDFPTLPSSPVLNQRFLMRTSIQGDVQLRPPSPPVFSYTQHFKKHIIVEEVDNSSASSFPRLDCRPPSPVVNSRLNMRHLEVSDGMNSKADGDFPELPSSPALNQRFLIRTSIQGDVQLRPPSPPVFRYTQNFKKHVIVEEVDNSSASSFPRLDCRPPSPVINSRLNMRNLQVSDGSLGKNSKADFLELPSSPVVNPRLQSRTSVQEHLIMPEKIMNVVERQCLLPMRSQTKPVIHSDNVAIESNSPQIAMLNEVLPDLKEVPASSPVSCLVECPIKPTMIVEEQEISRHFEIEKMVVEDQEISRHFEIKALFERAPSPVISRVNSNMKNETEENSEKLIIDELPSSPPVVFGSKISPVNLSSAAESRSSPCGILVSVTLKSEQESDKGDPVSCKFQGPTLLEEGNQLKLEDKSNLKAKSPEIFSKAKLKAVTRTALDTQAIDEFNTETLHLAGTQTKAEGWSSQSKISEILSDERNKLKQKEKQDAGESGSSQTVLDTLHNNMKKKSANKKRLLAELQDIRKCLESERRLRDYEIRHKEDMAGWMDMQVLELWGKMPLRVRTRTEVGPALLILSRRLLKTPGSVYPGCWIRIYPPWDVVEGEGGSPPMYMSIRACEIRFGTIPENRELMEHPSNVLEEQPIDPYLTHRTRLFSEFLNLPLVWRST